MKVTITGASGFVGQNLSIYLENNGLKVDRLSLREKGWKERMDYSGDAIIHLAGKAHDTSNTSKPDEYFLINRDLTIEVFNHFLNTEIKDFFYFSSVKAASDSCDNVLTEDVLPTPLTAYGKSKLEAEDYLLQTKLPLGKRVFIIRPCMIHGPGNKGNLNLLFKVVSKGIPWPLASFENNRSFLSVDNLCYLIKEMLDNRDIASGIYNFADDNPVSTNKLIQIIAEISGKKTKLFFISKKLISCVARIGDLIHLPLNSERLTKLTENYIVSNQKIKTELKIETLPVSSEQGLKHTIKSFKTTN